MKPEVVAGLGGQGAMRRDRGGRMGRRRLPSKAQLLLGMMASWMLTTLIKVTR